jgi:phosphatidate cytidylyltransferase
LKNFATRTVTGLIYVAIIITSICLHSLTFLSIFLIIMVLSMIEFYRLTSTDNIKPLRFTGIFTGIILLVSTYLFAAGKVSTTMLLIPVSLTFVIFFIELFRSHDKYLVNLGVTSLGLVYIALPLSLLPFIVYPWGISYEYNYEILLGYFVILWLYDTGAYIIGSFIGKHKIMEKISPEKSWEGLIGGWIISIGIALLIARIFPILSKTDWLIIATIIVITGTLGDFVESKFKRNAGIKDTGKLLPGHGGMLDRIDSVLLSVPFVFIFLMLKQYI